MAIVPATARSVDMIDTMTRGIVLIFTLPDLRSSLLTQRILLVFGCIGFDPYVVLFDPGIPISA